MTSWSWHELVKANGGDEEKALLALMYIPGESTGEYRDECHDKPSDIPVSLVPPDPGAPDIEEPWSCPLGHQGAIRNGFRWGRQRWACPTCERERRRHYPRPSRARSHPVSEAYAGPVGSSGTTDTMVDGPGRVLDPPAGAVDV